MPLAATKFIQTFGRKAFRRPLEPRRNRFVRGDLQGEKELSRRRAGRDRDDAAVPELHILARRDSEPKWKPYAKASRLAYFIWDTAPDDALLDSAARAN